MITKEDIERINYLSRKSKEQELNDEEKTEQQGLRRKYVEYIKSQLKVQLDNIEYVDDKKNCDCGCSCDHEHHHDHGHHHHHHHDKHDKN
ncbi:MAG: hypothetical protein K0Q65_2948 [Clostridia bacterium]|jgi:uncharacterized protein YnzC (UPF0291/DUF896 family)|nr:hypothetical protein [Clostridia bacterium]